MKNTINIQDYSRMVHARVKKYAIGTVSPDDLIQEGMLGLCEALNKWDPSKGEFSTIAMIYVDSYMYEFMRKNQYLVPITSSHAIKKANANIYKYRTGAYLSHEEAELAAKELNIPLDVVIRADSHALSQSQMVYLDNTDESGDSTSMDAHSVYPASNDIGVVDLIDNEEKIDKLLKAIDNLSPTNAEIIRARYLYRDPQSLKQLAGEMGITPQAVALREKTGLKQLREMM